MYIKGYLEVAGIVVVVKAAAAVVVALAPFFALALL